MNLETPKVAIVIISWNAVSYLADCLASIFSAGLPWAFEVFVVDNASSDGSAEMVSSRYRAVRLIRNKENLGFAKANNLALRLTRAPYVALINSDVYVPPNCIETLVDYCERNPKSGIVGPMVIGRDGKQQASCRGFPTLWNTFCRALALDTLFPGSSWTSGYLLRHKSHASEMPADILSGCFWLVRREALNEVGLLDEAFFIYGEDMDWCQRFWKAGWTAMFVPQAQAVHYGGASSSNAPLRFAIEMQRADCQYWAKHHSRVAAIIYIAIAMLHHALRSIGHRTAAVLRRTSAAYHLQRAQRSDACLKWLLLESPRRAAVMQVARPDVEPRGTE